VIPFNAIPDANVIPANDGLAIADPGSLRVTLRKGYCLIFNFRDFPWDPDKSRVGSGADVRRLENEQGQRRSLVRSFFVVYSSTNHCRSLHRMQHNSNNNPEHDNLPQHHY
jgi:hypothetical protein